MTKKTQGPVSLEAGKWDKWGVLLRYPSCEVLHPGCEPSLRLRVTVAEFPR